MALILAFASGRFSRTAETKTEFQEKVVYKDRVVEKIVEVEKKHEDKIRIVYRETKPDGTKTEREEERTKTDTDKKTDKAVEKYVVVEKEVTKTVTVKTQPRLMVSVLAGYDMSPAFLKIPSAPNLAVGIDVKVRVAGPIYLGVMAVNTGLIVGTVGATF